ncbi:MAG TPA: hypothetical protein VKX17_17540 [Planctomycetota bacterium]|nr:hypothetical protein [Planctomycetota bacterium]
MAAKPLRTHKPYPKPCCPVCDRTLKPAELKNGAIYCKVCGNTFEAVVFSPPAETIAVRPVVGGAEGVAPCAKHPLNAAEGNCERCGNFVCALCRTPLEGKVYCPACLERILDKGANEIGPEREPFAYGIANSAAFCGLLPPLGVVLGPMSIVYCIKWIRQAQARNKPVSNITGIVLTLALALADIAISVAIILWIVYMIQRRT